MDKKFLIISVILHSLIFINLTFNIGSKGTDVSGEPLSSTEIELVEATNGNDEQLIPTSAEEETSKNGEKFIVLMIYIAKKASMNNGIMEFNHSGYCECWIPEDIFWDNYSKTDVGKILFKQCSKEKHFMTPGFQMSFFAVGSTSGGYFNLYEKSSFIIEHPQPIIELAKKHGLSKTYLQIVQEYIETKKNEINDKTK